MYVYLLKYVVQGKINNKQQRNVNFANILNNECFVSPLTHFNFNLKLSLCTYISRDNLMWLI